jgi:hypothetical protein
MTDPHWSVVRYFLRGNENTDRSGGLLVGFPLLAHCLVTPADTKADYYFVTHFKVFLLLALPLAVIFMVRKAEVLVHDWWFTYCQICPWEKWEHKWVKELLVLPLVGNILGVGNGLSFYLSWSFVFFVSYFLGGT